MHKRESLVKLESVYFLTYATTALSKLRLFFFELILVVFVISVSFVPLIGVFLKQRLIVMVPRLIFKFSLSLLFFDLLLFLLFGLGQLFLFLLVHPL